MNRLVMLSLSIFSLSGAGDTMPERYEYFPSNSSIDEQLLREFIDGPRNGISLECMQTLLKLGIDINTRQINVYYGYTGAPQTNAIEQAIHACSGEHYQFLIENGAQHDFPSSNFSIASLEFLDGHWDDIEEKIVTFGYLLDDAHDITICEWLLNHGGMYEKNGTSPYSRVMYALSCSLRSALTKTEIDEYIASATRCIQFLINRNEVYAGYYREKALLMSAKYHLVEILKLLLSAGADASDRETTFPESRFDLDMSVWTRRQAIDYAYLAWKHKSSNIFPEESVKPQKQTELTEYLFGNTERYEECLKLLSPNQAKYILIKLKSGIIKARHAAFLLN